MAGQSIYTDKGHWIGIRTGIVPNTNVIRGIGLIGYEYRMTRFASIPFDLTAFPHRNDFATILGVALRIRFPFRGYTARNIYCQVGAGSGSMYPVYHLAAGFEYGFIEKMSLYFQFRHYSSNLDAIGPRYQMYSIGVNIDITPVEMRQSFLVE
jgi:hypothetical protein